MNVHPTCIPKGPAERWTRIRSLLADAVRARGGAAEIRNHDEEIAAARAEPRAADEIITELDQLAQQGVLEEIGNCLEVIYGRAEGI